MSCEYHGHGPVDNLGRTAKEAIETAEKEGNPELRLNTLFCSLKLTNPWAKNGKRRERLKGTFACNGEFYWRCSAADGTPSHPNITRVVKGRMGNVNAIHGSLELYSFCGGLKVPDRINCRFGPCICVKCCANEGGVYSICDLVDQIGPPGSRFIKKS